MAGGPLWTKQEIEVLKEKYATAPKEEIQRALPRHTSWPGIRSKALKLGLHRLHKAIYPGRTYLKRKLAGIELAYLAGVLDADGHISLRKSSRRSDTLFYSPTIGITNQSAKLMDWMDARIRWTTTSHEKGSGWSDKPIFRREARGHALLELLQQLLPYLQVKKERAQLVIQFCQLRAEQVGFGPYGEEEHELYREVWKLNHGSYPKT